MNASSLPLPQLTSIAPASARGAVTVSITGRDTHFVQGSSQANFGAGITVGSSSNTADGLFGPIVVTSLTTVAHGRSVHPCCTQTSPTDIATLAAMSLLFLMVAAVACFIPARQVTAIDPVIALRQE